MARNRTKEISVALHDLNNVDRTANKSAAGMQHTWPRDIFNVSNFNQGL